MPELEDKTYLEIQDLSAKGDRLAEEGNFSSALENYWKAFDLVPEPKTDWDTTTWILTAIGDSNFLGNDFQAGVDNLSNAMHCPDAIGNPFIHLRLGQCQLEIGNLDRATDELTRAYALEGEAFFSKEAPKYIEFLKTRIDTIPPKKKPWWKR
ncbi:hypothetical protein JBL43_00895 [Aureibaculum sp. A20]|uniref:Tetratricopeptide repeat protein n=1 Tax=Aureibaculum flavum TaxID=2795986 RepID=A0ABS0WLD4_9FLAO|nr:hypothetical protein [Aureibaculum flavum]MBJ2172773.1 hypothetical protein [Aureibaculum flavum]